jgi:hypothetical protein
MKMPPPILVTPIAIRSSLDHHIGKARPQN